MIIALSSEITVMSDVADRTGRDKKVVYIDTASNGQEGDKSWLENQVGAIENEYGTITRYSIEGKNISDFNTDLSQFDIIHIGGGNTAYLLFHILETGFDKYLKEIQNNKIIIGSSAGGIVLGAGIEHIKALDDFGVVELKDYNALGFFNFDIWVHFGKDKYREKYNSVLDIAYKASQSGIYLNDDSYIVSEKEGFHIYTVNS